MYRPTEHDPEFWTEEEVGFFLENFKMKQERPPLDRIEEYLEGVGRALRKDQTYDDLKTSTICLCNALQNLVEYIKESEKWNC